MPNEDKERQKKEYQAILDVFSGFLEEELPELEDCEEILEALSSLRAEFAISYALEGFDIGYEEALELIRDTQLTGEDEERRKVIVAAIDNLVDFAVAGEYQMLDEMEEALKEVEIESEEDMELIYEELLLGICQKFNLQYAAIENMDVFHAMMMATALSAIRTSTLITYRTQGDHRVRPWHAQYEGFSAYKQDFPGWLIPPIEHGCRCYLTVEVAAGIVDNINNKVVVRPEMPEWFNKTFKESVALGGRIFSDEHPYFTVKSEHLDMLNKVALKIKDKYFNA